MKKVLTILLSLALILSLSAAACADNDFALDGLLVVLEQAMKNNFGEQNVEINALNSVVLVNAWLDNAGLAHIKDVLNTDKFAQDWKSTSAALCDLQTSVQDSFASLSKPYVAIVNLLDPFDHTLLLSVTDGVVIYDVVQTLTGAAPQSAPEPAAQTDGMTMGQKNAVKSAESYLSWNSFSRQGLIEQLEFEGFSHDDAVFAVDHITVDWNEQAVKSAESYLSWGSFSRQSLIDQLEYEGFTHEQAVYGVEKVGY